MLESVSPVPRLGARELAHQGLKACLNKMLVEGQGLGHPGFAHDNERNTVHEPPCLLLMRFVQRKALREQTWVRR